MKITIYIVGVILAIILQVMLLKKENTSFKKYAIPATIFSLFSWASVIITSLYYLSITDGKGQIQPK